MKKLKLKKISNAKSKPKKESPSKIQQLIFADVKNINKFNIIIEEFVLSLQNNDEKNIKQISDIVFEIFDYFYIKNKNSISEDLISFLDEKLNIIFNVYLEVIDIDNEEESGTNTKNILRDIIKFLKFSTSENKRNSIFKSLVEKFIYNEDLVEVSQIKILTKSFQNKKYFSSFFDILFEMMNENIEEMGTEILYNIYNFMVSAEKISDMKIKSLYQNIFIQLINQVTLPKDILRNLLLNLNKFIFDNLENPLIFSDYLINIYERSPKEEFDIKILSLSGLFVLITKYKLDYANYYAVLYKTICMKYYDSNGLKTVFDSKYRNRFFKILELSLKSSTVPIIVILSFIKKLARICLFTSSNNIVIILGIIQNLIKLHPRSVILLIRKKTSTVEKKFKDEIKENSKFNWDSMNLSKEIKEEKKNDEENEIKNLTVKNHEIECINLNDDSLDLNSYAQFEQFNDDELDPYKTKANLSCLWEFYTLKKHFSFKIRNITTKFESNFIKGKEFDMNTVSNIKDEDMLYELTQTSNFYVHSIDPNMENFNEIHNKIANFI